MTSSSTFFVTVCALLAACSLPAAAVPSIKSANRQAEPCIGIQAITCCEADGRVFQASSVCACSNTGGTAQGQDLSQCPPSEEPTEPCIGIQALTCCEADGRVFQASSVCACTNTGGTVQGQDLSQCPLSEEPVDNPAPSTTQEPQPEPCVGPAVVVCCQLDGRLSEASSPCTCTLAGGSVTSLELSQCTNAEQPTVTPTPSPSSLCIQVETCCFRLNVGFFLASTPCACEDSGGFIFNFFSFCPVDGFFN